MTATDILSQDEIDALLNGVDNGDVDTSGAGDPPGTARQYDFTSQDRIVRGRLPTLEMVNERFARNFRITIFNMMRRSPVISVEGVEMLKFSEYIHSLFMPSNLNMVKVKPLRGTALVVMSPKLVYSLVENFFGGDGRYHTKIEGRDFTATEMRLVHKVLDAAFHDLQRAWEPVFKLKFSFMASEVNPHFANIVSPNEVVAVSTVHIELEGGAGDLQVVLPYSMIEPIRDLLDTGVQSDSSDTDERWINSVREDIKSAPVDITVRLLSMSMRLRDVRNFKVGDILPIEMPPQVFGRVDGVPVFSGKYGLHRGRQSVRLETLIHTAPPAPSKVFVPDVEMNPDSNEEVDYVR
jgi:flagellar motor switch protein FliM